MTAKVPMIDTGTATSGMSVVRSLPRNRKTTIATSTKAMTSVWMTSSMVEVTNTVESQNTWYSRSSGKRCLRSSMTLRTCAATSTALAPGDWKMPIVADGAPLNRL